MKKLYSYYPEIDNDEVMWLVYENISEQVVAEFFFEEDAEDLCRFLERGGGFSGFTPAFILRKSSTKDINEAFSMEFA